LRGARTSPPALAVVVAAALLFFLPSRVQAAPQLTARPSGALVHVVKAGESLGVIAQRYRVTVAALLAANRLPSSRVQLKVGRRLVIPRPQMQAVSLQRVAPSSKPPANLILAAPSFGTGMPNFGWPVEGNLSSQFGRRRLGWHKGIDIQADRGTPVVAAADGVVTVSGTEDRYGLVVKVEHPGGFLTVYAHHSENLVEIGDEVRAGQVIGYVGRTGRATNYHLHFEIRHSGLAYNPLYLLPETVRLAQQTTSEMNDDDQEDDE
jgi:murein DD-endopeptidase MepM/ murein hydrolase activator NlpD